MKFEETVGIGDVVKKCRVSEKQLRYWQDAGYVNPEKVVCGERAYRRYRASDVALVMEIKRLLDQGFTLSNASKIAKFNIEEKRYEKKD